MTGVGGAWGGTFCLEKRRRIRSQFVLLKPEMSRRYYLSPEGDKLTKRRALRKGGD